MENKTYEDGLKEGLNEGFIRASKIYEDKFKEQSDIFTEQVKSLKVVIEENKRLYDELENTRNNVLNGIKSRHDELHNLLDTLNKDKDDRYDRVNTIKSEINDLLKDLSK